jgi:hypothetical protein
MNKILLALILASSAAAQANDSSVARLVGLKGNVLVSSDSNIASAGESLRLVPGARVLVTINSKAVVEYHDGCRIELGAGERFEVSAQAPCATLAGSANAKVATR